MNIQREESGNTAIYRFEGEVSHAILAEAENTWIDDCKNNKHVALDFQNALHIHLSSLPMLLKLKNTLHQHDIRLFIIQIPSYFLFILHLMNVKQGIYVLSSEQELTNIIASQAVRKAPDYPAEQIRPVLYKPTEDE